eukprot:scaffold291955_cov32-Tisochrysis_lutea.AAC.3
MAHISSLRASSGECFLRNSVKAVMALGVLNIASIVSYTSSLHAKRVTISSVLPHCLSCSASLTSHRLEAFGQRALDLIEELAVGGRNCFAAGEGALQPNHEAERPRVIEHWVQTEDQLDLRAILTHIEDLYLGGRRPADSGGDLSDGRALGARALQEAAIAAHHLIGQAGDLHVDQQHWEGDLIRQLRESDEPRPRFRGLELVRLGKRLQLRVHAKARHDGAVLDVLLVVRIVVAGFVEPVACRHLRTAGEGAEQLVFRAHGRLVCGRLNAMLQEHPHDAVDLGDVLLQVLVVGLDLELHSDGVAVDKHLAVLAVVCDLDVAVDAAADRVLDYGHARLLRARALQEAAVAPRHLAPVIASCSAEGVVDEAQGVARRVHVAQDDGHGVCQRDVDERV